VADTGRQETALTRCLLGVTRLAAGPFRAVTWPRATLSLVVLIGAIVAVGTVARLAAETRLGGVTRRARVTLLIAGI
jgi:hypothetical protein